MVILNKVLECDAINAPFRRIIAEFEATKEAASILASHFPYMNSLKMEPCEDSHSTEESKDPSVTDEIKKLWLDYSYKA